jgi:hypothetical protein
VEADGRCGWWVDRAIGVVPLDPGDLVRGENVLTLAATMDDHCQLEAVFVLGRFAVEVEGAVARITGPLSDVGFGDWTRLGLPFYAGSVAFRTRIRPDAEPHARLFVEVPDFAGVCVRVVVDGVEAGVIGWEPHEIEITELVAGKADAELVVEVVGHRRNAFGPLHNVEARPRFVGPHSYVTTGDQWQDEYSLVPCGLLTAPRLSARKNA